MNTEKHINLHLSKFSYFLYIMINKGLAASTIRMKISFNTAKNYDWVKASTSRKGGLTWTCDTSKEFNKLFIPEKTINNHLSKLSLLYVYKKNVRNTFVGLDFGKPDQTYHNYSIRFLASSENLLNKRTPQCTWQSLITKKTIRYNCDIKKTINRYIHIFRRSI